MRRLLPVLAILMLVAACSTPTPTPKPVDLHATARMDGQTVMVTNNDTFTWQGVKVELRPSANHSGYSVTVSSIPANNTAVLGVSRFSNSDGVRFDPTSMLMQEIWISCDTQNGKAYWFGTWGQ